VNHKTDDVHTDFDVFLPPDMYVHPPTPPRRTCHS
jgi:hypothetical protein